MNTYKALAAVLLITAFVTVSSGQATKSALTLKNADIDMNENNITNLPTGGISVSSHAVSKGFTDAEYVNRGGDSMTGILDMTDNNITNVREVSGLDDATDSNDAVNLGQSDTRYVNEGGDLMTGKLDMDNNDILNIGKVNGFNSSGSIDMGSNVITDLGTASDGNDAVRLDQADTRYVNEGGDLMTGDLDMDSNNITNAGLGSNLDANGRTLVDLPDAVASSEPVPLGQADIRFLNRQSQDSMTANLSMSQNSINDVDILNANTKNFVQSINGTHEAVYTSQESRSVRAVVEGQVYVDSKETVELPQDFTQVASDTAPQVYVQVTPHSLETVAVTDRSTESITIESSAGVEVDYRVTAVRDGYESKTVVRPQ